MNARIIPIAALVTVAAIAAAASMQAVAIKWNPKKGASYKYKMEASMDFGQQVKVSGTLVNTIDLVTDEKVTVKVKNSIDAEGQTMESGSTDTYNRSGEVIESKPDTDMQGFNMRRMNQAMAFIYPGNEVKEGETWVHKTKADKAKDLFSSETTFKYEGTEEVDGVKCFKVTSVYKETDAPTNASSTNTFWISVDDTEMYKSTNSVKSLSIMEGMPAMNMEASTVRTK